MGREMFKGPENTVVVLPTQIGERREHSLLSQSFAGIRVDAKQHCFPKHLLLMAGTEWATWRLTGLRGAGFPADQVLKLASPGGAAMADALINADREYRIATEKFRAVLNDELDMLRLSGQWNDRAKRGRLLNALRDLKTNRIADPFLDLPAAARAFCAYDVMRKKVEPLRSEYSHSFQGVTAELSQTIHEIAADKRFQEAVIWQNRQAWHSAIKLLLRESPNTGQRTSKRRQHEELVASYLQRYCVKNDTIGFFGPVGWAHFVPEGAPLDIGFGPGPLAARSVYFEGWCIDKLAAVISKDESLRAFLAPRLAPSVRLENGTMRLPGGACLRLQPQEAVVLEACDGRRPANILMAELKNVRSLHRMNEAEIYRILQTFCNRGLLIWGIDVPLQRSGESALRALLRRIGDCHGRQYGLQALDKLESVRDKIAMAAGNPEELDRELTNLDEEFTGLTGAASTRAAGQTYAARTLVYEDCRRDIDVTIGPQVLQALAPALALLLTSVRWMTSTLADMYRDAFRSIYAGLVGKTRSKTVSAADLWVRCDSIFYKEGTRIADRILPLFQSKWMDVLPFSPEARRVHFTFDELQPRVAAAFPAVRPGWSHARYNSPDVMIAASGSEGLADGRFHLVIGEVHLGVNCLNGSLFVGQHPSPEEIHDAITADFPHPCIVPVPPKSWPTLTARTSFEFVSPRNYRLLISSDTGNIESPRALAISELVVEECNGQLLLMTRDRAVRFEIVEALGEFLSNLIMNFFVILPPLAHTPRITVDHVTIVRESWRFSPDQLEFAFQSDEATRFLEARRWARELGFPRFAFIKSPAEKKPFYVDFQSPVLVSLFGKIIRRTKDSKHPSPLITVAEMLPEHGQFWLPDSDGRYYTSELRMVTLDMVDSGPSLQEVI
jgi:Lantibiotic dehydratase, N terminus